MFPISQIHILPAPSLNEIFRFLLQLRSRPGGPGARLRWASPRDLRAPSLQEVQGHDPFLKRKMDVFTLW